MEINLNRAKFVSDAAQLEEMRDRAKLRRCPHCRQVGAMNSHGFLRGNSIFGHSDMIRGRRFFCSNRGYRPGCGRTVSILLQTMIHTFTVTTASLVSFVSRILAGTSVRAAWLAAIAGTLSERSGYRLWKRLRQEVTHLRSQLLRRKAPAQSLATEPIGQVVEHIKECIPGLETDTFAAFQMDFQYGIFSY